MSGSEWTSLLTIVGLLLTFASVTFAARELRQSRRSNQAEFLFNIMTWYLNDSALRDFFYKLDYNIWKFDASKLTDDNESASPSGPNEWASLDKMLFVFDLLGNLVEENHVSSRNLSIISFEASRVLHNPEIERYLVWLDNEYLLVGQPGPAYAAARRLGERFRTTGIADGTATTFTSERLLSLEESDGLNFGNRLFLRAWGHRPRPTQRHDESGNGTGSPPETTTPGCSPAPGPRPPSS